jgi:hypothetical protein
VLIDTGGPTERGARQSNSSSPASGPGSTASIEPSSSTTTTATVPASTSLHPQPDSVTLRHCELPNGDRSASPAESQSATEPNTGDNIRRILDSDPGWSTILSAAHAAYTAPNDIVSPLENAARSNRSVATTIDHLAANWSEMSVAEHASAATDLLNLGKHTPGVTRAGRVIARENALPTRVAETLTSWSHGNGLQRLAARVGNSAPGKWLFDHSVNTLAPEARGQFANISSHYSSAAEKQLAEAAAKGGKLPFLDTLSTKFEDLGGEGRQLDNPVARALARVPVLKDIPVAGALISTISAAYDIGVEHENPMEAVGKEYGGLAAGQLAYNATLRAFPSGASTGASTGADLTAEAVSDGAATAATDVAAGAAGDAALGAGAELAGEAIVVGGPATWVVAAGVGAAVAVGFAATKFIEGSGHDFGDAVTQGGREIGSGIAHGNIGEIGTGFADGADDVGKGVEHGGEAVVQGFKSVGSAIGSLF